MYTRIPPQLQSSRAGPNTRCQKCLQFGHFSYNCKAAAATYVARPSRTKQLADASDIVRSGGGGGMFGRGKDRDQPSVEVPDEFKKGPAGVGLADEILRAKEEARRRLGVEDKKGKKGKGKEVKKSKKSRKRSPSPSSDSDSDSRSDSSDSSSSSRSRSPPRRVRKRYSSSPPPSRTKDAPRQRSPSPERRRRRSSSNPDARRSRSPIARRPAERRRSRSRS